MPAYRIYFANCANMRSDAENLVCVGDDEASQLAARMFGERNLYGTEVWQGERRVVTYSRRPLRG
jgi:hypothetical protein